MKPTSDKARWRLIATLAVKYKHQLKISLVLNCKLVYILSCQIKNKRRINEL